MPSVKGSRQDKMIVVPYRPRQRALVVLALVVLFLGTGAGAHYLGFSRGLDFNGDARAERDLLRDENQLLRSRLSGMQQQLVNAEQESRVDRESLQQVQGTMLTLRERIAQLEEDILFYKNIMAPEEDKRGLVIGQFDLVALEESGWYRYRLEFRQQGDNQHLVNGYANVNILGHQDGSERWIPLHDVSGTVDQQDLKLRFQYFQNIEGKLRLPDGFTPETVQILAVSESEVNAGTVEKSFGWVVQDNE